MAIIIISSLYVSTNPQLLSGLSLGGYLQKQQQIKIGDTVVNVDVADTPSLRTAGLSGRQSLGEGQGMLFVFPESKKYQFWMKGMHFPLDFIFISQGRVVDILPNIAQPSSSNQTDLPVYEPTVPIDMMLEVNAGFAGSHNIKVGDSVFQIQNP